MLRYIRTHMTRGENHKLWFQDHNNDLFIWLNENRQPTSFQFCYNKAFDEHSISWQHQNGFYHSRIDSGEDGINQYKMSPIMISDETFKHKEMADLLLTISQDINPELINFIYHKILSYPDQT